MHYLVMEYIVLKIICYSEFSTYYTVNNKSNQLSEYQPDEF